MARVVFCLPALRSHAATHGALANALGAKGHQAVFLGTDGLAEFAAVFGVAFQSLGFQESDIAQAGLLRVLRAIAANTAAWISKGAEALAKIAPDLVIVDQVEPGAALACEAAGYPYLSLAAALPLDRDARIPPPYVPWPYLEGEKGEKRNRGGWRVADALMTMQARALRQGCRDHGLPVRAYGDEWISELCDLRQLPPGLDFPHQPPPSAQAVGPLRSQTLTRSPEMADGKPVVFASLGSLQGGRRRLIKAMAEAAAGLGARVYLAHGGRLNANECKELPESVHVADFHDQIAVLSQASACITHAGMNTVLDCVALEVPMVAIPLAFEQPAIAARLNYHGVAHVLKARRANVKTISDALAAVLGDPGFHRALAPRAQEIREAGGVARAASLVEEHLPTAKTRNQQGAAQ